MDSISVTALRTAAASAVAAKYLARKDWKTVAVCGCGGQAIAQIQALLALCTAETVTVYDIDGDKARRFAAAVSKLTGMTVKPSADLGRTGRRSRGAGDMYDCKEILRQARRRFGRGTFIAAVGADHEHKQEIQPELLAAAKVVTDLTTQAIAIGDLHRRSRGGNVCG